MMIKRIKDEIQREWKKKNVRKKANKRFTIKWKFERTNMAKKRNGAWDWEKERKRGKKGKRNKSESREGVYKRKE